MGCFEGSPLPQPTNATAIIKHFVARMMVIMNEREVGFYFFSVICFYFCNAAAEYSAANKMSPAPMIASMCVVPSMGQGSANKTSLSG